jgi:hypothetical protein
MHTDLLVFLREPDQARDLAGCYRDAGEKRIKGRIGSLPFEYRDKTIDRQELVIDVMAGDPREEAELFVGLLERFFSILTAGDIVADTLERDDGS